jgi:hypothetical protein
MKIVDKKSMNYFWQYFLFLTFSRWDVSFFTGGVFIALSGLLALVIGTLKMADSDDDDDPNNNENEGKF